VPSGEAFGGSRHPSLPAVPGIHPRNSELLQRRGVSGPPWSVGLIMMWLAFDQLWGARAAVEMKGSLFSIFDWWRSLQGNRP
jgi:hypothetical protein